MKKTLLFATVIMISLTLAGQKTIKGHALTEVAAIQMVMKLPEVQESCAYVRKKTGGKRRLFPLVYGKPNREHLYYWIAVGEDNGMCFVTHFGFFVHVRGRKIFYYDTLNGTEVDLQTWRKSLGKK